MKFFLDDMVIVFPYDYIYPEQLEYITSLKRGLDAGGHLVLEMPSGTGKTISLLSLLVAYLNHHPKDKLRVVYCTRTVVEMSKTMEELRRLVAHWEKEGVALRPLLAVSQSARKNMCIEENVSRLTYGSEVDAACRAATAPWTPAGQRCSFLANLEENNMRLPSGVHSMDDIRRWGRENGCCPYYATREAIRNADIVVHSYMYLIDPKVSDVVMQHLTSNTIVVMDEGHNVDDVCIEAYSMIISRGDAHQAREQNMPELSERVERVRQTNRQRLQDEYDRLVSGLALAQLAHPQPRGRGAGAGAGATGTAGVGQPQQQQQHARALPDDLANEAIPGNLRQASHFLTFLQRCVDFIWRVIGRMTQPQIADPLVFLTKMKEECSIDLRHLRFTSERLRVLLNTLEISDPYRFRHVALIADFVAVLSTHYKDDRHDRPGFAVISEPFDPENPSIPDPVLRLTCLDASLAVRKVFSTFRSVVLTSGTLHPLEMYPKILGFQPVIARSFPMTLSRNCICPVIVTRSADQTNLLMTEDLSSSYNVRIDAAAQQSVTKAYAMFLLDLAKATPDGIVCFFTGYRYMSEVVLDWERSGFLTTLSAHKLIFIETQGVSETSTALANYRHACDIGRGAIFFSIARGKIAEGIDFDRHYGRAVVVFGVPYLPPDDRSLKERMRWMEQCLGIPDAEFRTFDAVRQASQCIGRVLRNKTDYGMMILVDRRWAIGEKRRKLPIWIQNCIKDNGNLSTEAAVTVARSFFKEMAQPWDLHKDLGSTLLDAAALRARGLMTPTADPRVALQQNQQPAATAAATAVATATVIVATPSGGSGVAGANDDDEEVAIVVRPRRDDDDDGDDDPAVAVVDGPPAGEARTGRGAARPAARGVGGGSRKRPRAPPS